MLMLTCSVILEVYARALATDDSALMYFGSWHMHVRTLLHPFAPFWTEAKHREASLGKQYSWFEHANYKAKSFSIVYSIAAGWPLLEISLRLYMS